MEIKRDLYLNKLIRREHNGLIKIVTGIRRCGKSYLLFNLFHQYLLNKGIKEDHIIEVALDNIKPVSYTHLIWIYFLFSPSGLVFSSLFRRTCSYDYHTAYHQYHHTHTDHRVSSLRCV